MPACRTSHPAPAPYPAAGAGVPFMRRATAAATVLALLAAGDVDARQGCHTRACADRVTNKHRRAVVRPHRPWLRSTRACESGGDYRAVSPGGTYRGAYQFDLSSWRGAGGRGDPINAGRLEQDYRAIRWRRLAGRSAWPRCG